MKNKLVLILVLLITLLGGFLRFYQNSKNPPSLNGDEVSMGYDAYSILKTSRDQYGEFMPLTFQSVGDYKNPVPVYLMVIPIKLFGLNEFSVRFQNAFIGTLTIPVFFLFLNKMFKSKVMALVGSFFLAISSWHIFYSRIEYESTIASLFVLLGIWFFMKMFEGGIKWAFLSSFFLILTMYTAPAARLFVPIFILLALLFYFRKLKRNIIITFILSCILFSLPLTYASLFLGANTRLSMVLIYNDIEFSRYVLLHNFSFQSITDTFLLVFFWLKRYLDYLQPDFLFLNGMNLTQPGAIGLGMFYLFELIFLVLGIKEFIVQEIPFKSLLVIWLIAGIFPDSITNNQQHVGRLLHIAPIVILISTLGAKSFYQWVLSLDKLKKRFLIASAFVLFGLMILTHAFLTIVVHYPFDKGESIDEGLKQVALYIKNHQGEYSQIVVDPRRGIEGPYLISNPYLYLLFYFQYDPLTYQSEPKAFGSKDNPNYRFSKYAFRYIDWSKDQDKKGVLFVGSPWSFPPEGIKPEELLGKVYLSDGHVAYYFVTPK